MGPPWGPLQRAPWESDTPSPEPLHPALKVPGRRALLQVPQKQSSYEERCLPPEPFLNILQSPQRGSPPSRFPSQSPTERDTPSPEPLHLTLKVPSRWALLQVPQKQSPYKETPIPKAFSKCPLESPAREPPLQVPFREPHEERHSVPRAPSAAHHYWFGHNLYFCDSVYGVWNQFTSLHLVKQISSGLSSYTTSSAALCDTDSEHKLYQHIIYLPSHVVSWYTCQCDLIYIPQENNGFPCRNFHKTQNTHKIKFTPSLQNAVPCTNNCSTPLSTGLLKWLTSKSVKNTDSTGTNSVTPLSNV